MNKRRVSSLGDERCEKEEKKIRSVIINVIISISIVVVGIPAATDYVLCRMQKEPVFAVRDYGPTDVIMYR